MCLCMWYRTERGIILQMDWQALSSESHFKTAVAVREALQHGDLETANEGIEELIDAMSRAERRAARSQLVRLMTHILKWKAQPEKRSRSWLSSIYQARDEIQQIQEETPSITDDELRKMWDRALRSAIRLAEIETGLADLKPKVSWREAFEIE